METALAVELLLAGLDRLVAWGAKIAQAQAEGRKLTEAEIDEFVAGDDAARVKQVAAIAKAKAEGR